MRLRLLFLLGIAGGYVLGTRAGRERYLQLRERADEMWHDPRIEKAREDAVRYAREQAPALRDAATQAASKAADLAHDVAEKTATTARDVAERTATTAHDLADRTSSAAKNVAARVTGAATEARGLVTDTASDVQKRVTGTADELKERSDRAMRSAAEARDDALASLDDEDEISEAQDGVHTDGHPEAATGTAAEVRAATIGDAGPSSVDAPSGEGERPGGVAPTGR